MKAIRLGDFYDNGFGDGWERVRWQLVACDICRHSAIGGLLEFGSWRDFAALGSFPTDLDGFFQFG
jgi:hypothetical protein